MAGLASDSGYEARACSKRDKLESLLNEMLEYVLRSNLYTRLCSIDMTVTVSEDIEKVHDLGSQTTRQRLEDIFYLLRLARQGR